jgi:DNA processing protein
LPRFRGTEYHTYFLVGSAMNEPQPASQSDALAGWLRLTHAPGIGNGARRNLLKAFGLPEAIFAASYASLAAVVGSAVAGRLLSIEPELSKVIEAALMWAEQPGNHLLTLADAEYPPSLLTADDPPLMLYARGRVELLAQPMFAIVGSRNATAQGERDAEAFAAALGQAGLTVVSGLALGIDAAAHRGGLNTVAGTVAVIGTGADRLYPARNEALAREIVANGVILSEFALGTPALAANFPRRNRLIAGLGLGCLVVEAAPKSGSLITARLAAEAGRDVFAIPGSIHSPLARGCHQLIRQGAKLVESAQDILEELRWTRTPIEKIGQSEKLGAGNTVIKTVIKTDDSEERVLTLLGRTPCNLDTLATRSDLTPETLLAILLPLELAGRIAQLPGGLYQRLD